jgi:hypothetical protein
MLPCRRNDHQQSREQREWRNPAKDAEGWLPAEAPRPEGRRFAAPSQLGVGLSGANLVEQRVSRH